jgi:tRNA threonylcarbamoyladenosine biosynthesis protein TsaB
MKILAFDGTAKAATVAVTDGERALGYYTIDNGLTQSELLLPMAENLLKSLNLSFSDVELYATSVGPGSFTGVRIGVSLVKGLAFGRDIPCVEVSTLEALAENLRPLEGIIVPCMDARRQQVYNALFECVDGKMCRLTEDRAISLSALAEELKNYDKEKIYAVGDGYAVAVRGLTECGIILENTPLLLRMQNAASVARVAYRECLRGNTLTAGELSPTYLRLPQAERERLERLQNG